LVDLKTPKEGDQNDNFLNERHLKKNCFGHVLVVLSNHPINLKLTYFAPYIKNIQNYLQKSRENFIWGLIEIQFSPSHLWVALVNR
jgi:hypothetical protein